MHDETAAAEWMLWSTTMRVVVTNTVLLDRAAALVSEVLDDIGQACDRFDAESEINTIAALLPAGVEVSDTLALLVRTTLNAARLTGGDVDPTLGNALVGLGYDRDISEVRNVGESRAAASSVPSAATVVTLTSRTPGYTRVTLEGNRLTVPADLSLDLGATAKALAADLAAATVFEQLGCGVLVSLGGDIATAGPAPARGWQITVCDQPGDPECQVTLAAGQALATSSTQKRRWQQNGKALHHILDPARGLPAMPVWRSVTVAAPSCVRANTVSTASIVRGYRAIAWLAQRGTTARLVNHDGRVLTLGGWPDENSVHVRQAS
ncbi:FAD:protein FMN transferase [Subtercola lobariae]|uniref:FAD:protein FMN transferase n=2 Tax=Subtercola lobariae TaxID=1588641 RepID=A0A917B587_9MICO|nr:FAD:protein FMN transferase [Subtercola lobariae]GGF24846.1 FAD:protein FMN transferase [Subtercola lobariae]